MKPTKRDDDAIVDLLDVLLDQGVVVEADVLITVADVPLVGVKLRAAVAGMATMTEYGMFEEWDEAHREANRPESPDTAAEPSEIPVSDDDRKTDER